MIDYNRYILTSKDSALESIISNALLLSIQIVLLVFSSKWMGAINKLKVGIFICLPITAIIMIWNIYSYYHDETDIKLELSSKGIMMKDVACTYKICWDDIRCLRLDMGQCDIAVELRNTGKKHEFSLSLYSMNPYQLLSAIEFFSKGHDIAINVKSKLWMPFHCNPFHNGFRRD